MFSLNTQVEFEATLKQFSKQKQAEYSSHAYTSGYFQSLAVNMFRYLSKAEQKLFARQMEREVEKANLLNNAMKQYQLEKMD